MYTELQVSTHFSFLRGVSSAEELFAAAALLGYRSLGIADRDSVGGLVKALRAAEATGVRLVAGCRLDLMDGPSLLVWPEDRAAWSRLTRLLTLGKSRIDRRKGEKGRCFLHWEDVAAWADGLVAALVPGEGDRAAEIALAQTADIFGEPVHLLVRHVPGGVGEPCPPVGGRTERGDSTGAAEHGVVRVWQHHRVSSTKATGRNPLP